MDRNVQLAPPPPPPEQLQRSGSAPAAAAERLEMCSSLYVAARRGRAEEVLALLLQQRHAAPPPAAGVIQHGQCDILEETAESNTVLHVAAEQGRGELIQELCHRFIKGNGFLISRRNSALDTPLHCAARAGHAGAVTVLVDLARDCAENTLGCQNAAGDTALHLAARHGHGAAVEALVAAGASASELNKAGVSPLYLAVMSRSLPAVKAIVTTCGDASSVGPSSQNALHAACSINLFIPLAEMVDRLLAWKPALAGQVDCNGSSPLHFAASNGDRSVVRAILLAAPPGTVYMKDSDGLSALHVAALMGHAGVVKEIISARPDAAELRDGHGETFLHAAARDKRPLVVSVAVKNSALGGLLNARDGDGNTPLHLAVAAGAPPVVEALLRKGKVRTDVLNEAGYTPLDLAAKSTSYITMACLVMTLVSFRARGRPQRQDLIKPWSGRNIAERIEKTSDSLAVVAGLIAAAAFTAGFNMPGSYGENGEANLERKNNFKIFLVLDTVAVAASVVAVILLVFGKASRAVGSWKSLVAALHCLWVSLISLILSFYASLCAAATTRARARGGGLGAASATAARCSSCTRFIKGSGFLSRRNSALDTPLHCAARAGHVGAVTVLVDLARDCAENTLGCQNAAGDTALHLAARHGHGAAVEALVAAGASASELNKAGVSPLYLAVMSRSLPAVKAIVTTCGDASSVGPSSQNALHAAVFQRRTGYTALDLAAKSTSYITMTCLVMMLVSFGARDRLQRQDHVKPWSNRNLEERIEKTSQSLAVVAGLVAGAAFTAGFSMPGNTIAVATSVVAVILLAFEKASRVVGSWKSLVATLHCLWLVLVLRVTGVWCCRDGAARAMGCRGQGYCGMAARGARQHGGVGVGQWGMGQGRDDTEAWGMRHDKA
ncbi:hypothetical protein ABZP36_009670 [Zizania latifolia]